MYITTILKILIRPICIMAILDLLIQIHEKHAQRQIHAHISVD